MKDLAGINIRKVTKKVRHVDLPLIEGSDSMFRRKCPTCEEGILCVRRDPHDGFRLSAFDNCLLCGQTYFYTDIDDLRKMVGDSQG